MKFLNYLVVTSVFISCICAHVIAQAPPPPKIDIDSSKTENIIITKKNPVKEKVTVVIDGNDVTVNGKPVEDFKSSDINITRHDVANIDGNFNFSGDDFAPFVMSMPDDHTMMMNDQLKNLHNQMKMHINANSAFLGVMSEKANEGAKIKDVTKASAAEKAGLKTADIITKINDTAIIGPDELYKIVGNHKPGDKITIAYLRDGKTLTAQAVLGKQNQTHVYSWNAPNENFNQDFSRNFNHNFSFDFNDDKPRLGITAQDTEDGNGVKVTGIDDEDAVAAKAGLKEDDVITQVNGKSINSTDDLKQSMKDVKKGDIVKISFKRNNQTQTVDVKFPKELKTIDL